MTTGTPANAIAGDVLHLSGGVWRDDDNDIRFPSENTAVVLPEGIEFPIVAVGQCPNGRNWQIDISRVGSRVLVQFGPEVVG